MYSCKMSVRSLVEYLYQSGDLISSSSSIERANLGSRIHRELQSSAQGNYESEVYLKHSTEYEGITFEIEGRADGILTQEDGVIIEEIKTTAIPYDDIQDTHFVHFAQAYCYGYFYMFDHQLPTITIRLTYYQIETHQIKNFDQSKTFEELKTFYYDTLKAYLKWANLSKDIQKKSETSLKAMQFPFPQYRKGQRDFAIAVYKTILDKDILFAQAPTGIGKTISTLFPSLKAIGEGKAEKIFYVCAKNITANVAYDTIQMLYQNQIRFKTVGICAKDKICLLEERNCDPTVCPYAKGYYDRCNDALYEVLTSLDFIVKDTIVPIAIRHRVCPFELSLDASLQADVIVGDYNYIFDPRVYLKRFFMEKGNYIFLVDEAHNLVDRAREMYSAELLKSEFLHIKALISKDRKVLQSAISKVNKELLRLRQLCESQQQDFLTQKEPILIIRQYLVSFIEHMDAYLQSEHNEEHDEALKDVYFKAINFNKIADFYDEHFVSCLLKNGNDLLLRQYCMNPRNPLVEILRKGRSTIFFSATLSPIDYYLDLLGGNEETKRLSLPSPFPKEHVQVMIANQISTRYRNRASSLSDISAMIFACTSSKKGNYIVFSPSYAYMKQIVEQFQNDYPEIDTILQSGDMNEEERNSFLKQFDQHDHLKVYFCVVGGMFSEGIDLKGDKLIGAIIVGVGLPQLNPWQDLIKEHFDETKQMGYAYAYQFPGMNKVLQSAGRVIRSSQDKGIIFLIDERYTSYAYKHLLPQHLRQYTLVHTPQDVKETCDQFWEGEL
ncbi:ATP-dependent DNA helicase [Amedibacillus sp. YH-ame10]